MAFEVRTGMAETAPGEYFEIVPTAGEVWTIQNVYTPEKASLYISDGTYDLLIAEMSDDHPDSMGFMGGFIFQLVSDHYLKVKNDDAAAQTIGYGGKCAMAFGDIVYNVASLADAEVMEIKPASGSYIIQNIYLEAAGDVEFSNGTYDIKINRNPETTSILCGNYECDATNYLKITNTSGSAALFGYDGFKL